MALDVGTIETYVISSASENEEEGTTQPTTNSQKDRSNNSDEDILNWKKAALARDLNVIHSCTLMIVKDITSAQRTHLHRNIVDTLKDLKETVMVGKRGFASTLSWKNALIARNLDLIDASLHILMMKIPPVIREQYGRTILAALQDLKRLIQKNERPAEHLIHCMEITGGDSSTSAEEMPNVSHPRNEINPNHLNRHPRRELSLPPTANFIARINKILEGRCPICNRLLPSDCGLCTVCKMFTRRMEKRISNGYYLECDHEDFSGGAQCRSCRYFLFKVLTKNGSWICKKETKKSF